MIRIPTIKTNRDEVQKDIKKASTELYKVAKASYGPQSGNVILGFTHGAPLFSHDGVTNLKMVRHQDPFIDDIIQSIKTASEQNNQKAGDGTTAVVILQHHLLMAAQRMEGRGLEPREIVRKLKEAEQIAFDYIDKIKKPVKKNLLAKVATISANDSELGMLIADVMNTVGSDGGVMIESYEGLGVHPEIVKGFYFNKGYRDTDLINDKSNNQSNHFKVPILISTKKFSTEVDIAPLIQKLLEDKFTELIIMADIGEDALRVLQMMKSKGMLLATVVEPPFVSGSRTLFLDDIALLTGAKVFDGVDFEPEKYLGYADEVLVTANSTTVIGGDADNKELKTRIEELRKQLTDEADTPLSIQFAKDRLARLSGKMAIIKVGGALEFERDELKLRIQDAVSAVQSAIKDGIVPGGGVTLARVKGSDFDDAFQMPFRTLFKNAGLNADTYLAHLEGLEPWFGFDLNNIQVEPKNTLEIGVIDATLVIREVVRNAVSVACGLIMSGASLSYEEKD